MRSFRAIRVTSLTLIILSIVTPMVSRGYTTAADGPGQKKPGRQKFRSMKRRSAAKKSVTLGVIENKSKLNVWITADSKKYCLKPNESSDSLGINDADGLLLDGRPVLFDSLRTDLGGGKIWNNGAIKVCDPGRLTVEDGLGPAYLLKASISAAGYLCPSEPAGYKTPEWCRQHPGWDIATAPVGRPC